MVDFDTTARQLFDSMGPPEMANLMPVLREFGGLDIAVGSDRVLMRRGHERSFAHADPGRLSDRSRCARG